MKGDTKMRIYDMYVNGEFVKASSNRTIKNINPSTKEVISEIQEGTVEDTRLAIEAAEAAQKDWSKLPASERAHYLKLLAQELRENCEFLAKTIVEEQGKIIELARTEVNFTADYIDYMAGWARKYEGEIVQSDRKNENILVYKEPLGVIAGILPWNFPFFLIARKAAPALVTGNTIVIKPSEETSNNAIEFAKLVDKIGFPKGVFNIVTGYGETVGQELASNPKTAMISLTGSVGAGQAVMKAAANNITKVNLELGGKAPAIIMSDANLDLAVEAVVNSRVINTGQVCNCAERVYVQADIAEEFVNRLVRRMETVKYGNVCEQDGLEMGPLINEAALHSVDAKVKKAVEQGAQVALGGQPGEQSGYYYQPTVLVNVNQQMDIMQEETFGPVLPIMTFKDLSEAIDLANDSEYGLTSSIYTQNIDVAMRAANELKFGETYINRENFEAIQGFHAGWRKSGIGGADGKHGLEEYLQTHVVYIQYNLEQE